MLYLANCDCVLNIILDASSAEDTTVDNNDTQWKSKFIEAMYFREKSEANIKVKQYM